MLISAMNLKKDLEFTAFSSLLQHGNIFSFFPQRTSGEMQHLLEHVVLLVSCGIHAYYP